jgi:6-phosphogluconolactonase
MLKIFADLEELSQFAARQFSELAQEATDRNGRFSVALTGGSSPKRLHQLLATPPYRAQIPWQKVHIFWGDERYVPMTDDRSNAKMAFDALLHHVDIPENQIHVMTSHLPPETFASQYEQIIKDFFQGAPPIFDLILLGMGEDGHTASLFPETEVLQEKEKLVSSLYLPSQSMHRITMTAPLINQASQVIMLVFGKKKAKTLHQVLKGPYQPEHLPVQLIQPENGELTWLVDEEAASHLK